MTSTHRIMPFSIAITPEETSEVTTNDRMTTQSSSGHSKIIKPFKRGKISLDSIPAFIQKVEAAPSMAILENVLKSYFQNIGVRISSYRHIPLYGSDDYHVPRIISFFGFSEDWLNYYQKEQLCMNDPIFDPVIKAGQVFTWHELITHAPKTEAAIEYADKVKNLNVSFGLAVPTYGANHRSGVFMLGFENYISALDETEIAALHWACQIAHHKYIYFIENRAVSNVTITKREAEILKWVSLGKSNREIADIMGISRHTVNAFIRSTFAKLDVYERVSASLRAIALGLI